MYKIWPYLMNCEILLMDQDKFLKNVNAINVRSSRWNRLWIRPKLSIWCVHQKFLSSMCKLQYLNLSWFVCLTKTWIQWWMMANKGMSPEFFLHNVEGKIQKIRKIETSNYIYYIYICPFYHVSQESSEYAPFFKILRNVWEEATSFFE